MGCEGRACVCARVRHLDASHAGLVRCVNREESVVARKHRAAVSGHANGRVAGWQVTLCNHTM